MIRRNINFWLIQIPGWLLLLYLIYAQAIPAFSYEAGVVMGTQEPAETVSDVLAVVMLPAAFVWNWRHGEVGRQ